MTKTARSEAPRRRHRLRTEIYQASWNYQYRDSFPIFIGIAAVAGGLLLESWWIGLAIFFLLSVLPHFSATVGWVSLFWGLICGGLGGLVGYAGFDSMGASVVLSMVAFALGYVPMRSSEQYWRDLEKDGGPYSD